MGVNEFERLTDEELELAERVGVKLSVVFCNRAYFRQENFTVCMIAGVHWGIGVAKRAPDDVDRPEHAKRLAFRRAASDYAGSITP